MNPIDQMMQAFGNSPSQAIAGLLGISPGAQAQGVDANELATQFAAALQTAQETGDFSAVLPGLPADAVQGLDLANLTPDQIAQAQAELFASLGIEAPAAAGIPVGPLPSLGTEPTEKETDDQTPHIFAAGVTLVSYEGLDSDLFAKLQQAGIPFNDEGIAVVPMSDLEALGLKLEQLPALPTGEQLVSTGQAAVPDSSRVIQPSNLQAALVQPQQAAATPQASTAPAAPQAQVQQPVAADPALVPEADIPDLLLGDDAVKQAAAAAGKPQPASTPTAAAPAATDTPVQKAADAAVAAQSIKSLQAAADQAKQMDEAAHAEQAARAQAEGHGTTTVAAQQAAGKKTDGNSAQRPTISGNTQANSIGSGKDGIKLAAKVDGEATASSMKEAQTHQAVEPARAKADTQPASHATAAPKEPVQWAPERLFGLPDSTSASAMASGLAGLKGESSLMNSMGLLGGRASPELGHQVGQQLNASVTKAVKAGQQEFTLRLNPSELGRVQVKLNFLEGGRVQAQVMAERPETLELLQRDPRGLERAIEAGGSKADGGIEFSLEDKDGQSAGKAFAEAMQQEKMREQMDERSGGGEAGPDGDDEMMQEEIPLEEILSQVTVETGLDVRV